MAVFQQHDVFRLDVAMDDALQVGVLQGGQQFYGPVNHRARRQRLSVHEVDALAQGLTPQPFHDHERSHAAIGACTLAPVQGFDHGGVRPDAGRHVGPSRTNRSRGHHLVPAVRQQNLDGDDFTRTERRLRKPLPSRRAR